MGAEVVEHEVQPHIGWVEGADVAAEGEELDSGLARLDVAVEAVGGDVVGADEVPDAVWAGVGGADPLGFVRGAQALPPGWGWRFSGPNSSRQITIAWPVSAGS